MQIIDFEAWTAAQGASRQAFGDAGMHSPAAHVGRSNWAAKMRSMEQRNADLSERRNALRIEYDQLVASGEIRPRTYQERLIDTANGDPMKESTKAAMRLCIKKGWPWHRQ